MALDPKKPPAQITGETGTVVGTEEEMRALFERQQAEARGALEPDDLSDLGDVEAAFGAAPPAEDE